MFIIPVAFSSMKQPVGKYLIVPSVSRLNMTGRYLEQEVKVDDDEGYGQKDQQSAQEDMHLLRETRNFGWAIPGELGGMAEPRSEDDFNSLLKVCGNHTVLFISLTENENKFQFTLPYAMRQKIDFYHLPLKVPYHNKAINDLYDLVARVMKAKSYNIPVIVHCEQGINRTGWILTYLLVKVWHNSRIAEYAVQHNDEISKTPREMLQILKEVQLEVRDRKNPPDEGQVKLAFIASLDDYHKTIFKEAVLLRPQTVG